MSTPQGPWSGSPPQGEPGQYPGHWGAPPPDPGVAPADPSDAGQPVGSNPPPGQGYPPPAGGYPSGTYPPGAYPPPGGYPPPAGAPGSYPPPTPNQAGPNQLPPAAPAKRKMAPQRIVILSVIGVLVVAAAIWGFLRSQQATVNAKVGDCIQVEGNSTVGQPKTSQIDCSDAKARFVVTAVGDDSLECDDGEAEYYQENRSGEVTDRICLRPNLIVGQCFVPPPTSVQLPQVGACSSIDGMTKLKVLSIYTDTADDARCPAEAVGSYSLVKRNFLACFGKP